MLFFLSAWEKQTNKEFTGQCPSSTRVYLLGAQDLNPRGARCCWRPGCCFLLGMAVGWQRRVSWCYLGSLRAEPPLICRRMCFNRKNKSCPYLRSLAPAGAKSQRRLRAPAAPRQRHSLARRFLCKPRAAGGGRCEGSGEQRQPVRGFATRSLLWVRQRSERSGLRAAPPPLPASPAIRARPAGCLFVSCVFAGAFVSSAF